MEQTGATVNTGGDPNAHAHGWNMHSHPHDAAHTHCDCHHQSATTTQDYQIVFCKLHAQAPALLEALEELGTICSHCEWWHAASCTHWEARMECHSNCQQARNAIEAAK